MLVLQNLQSGTKNGKITKLQDTQKSKKSRIAKITKLSVLSVKRWFSVISIITLFVLMETLLYCNFYAHVNCVLTEHLAECERFKYFSKYKVVKSKLKVYQVHFLVSPFCTCNMCLYMNLMSSYMSEW